MVGHIDSRDSAQKPAVVFRNKANRGVLDAMTDKNAPFRSQMLGESASRIIPAGRCKDEASPSHMAIRVVRTQHRCQLIHIASLVLSGVDVLPSVNGRDSVYSPRHCRVA